MRAETPEQGVIKGRRAASKVDLWRAQANHTAKRPAQKLAHAQSVRAPKSIHTATATDTDSTG